MTNKSILCVDDDEMVLKGIQRQLGDEFDITTAPGPHQALALIEQVGPFAVVVSDMRMPEMNGIELLKQIRIQSENTVRMMLTGFADLKLTIEAVNEGNVFRFLAKPCSEEVLAQALHESLRQFALQEAEKELVEGTLHGCIKVLADVLSLVNPITFGQSTRVRSTVDGILKRLNVDNHWQLEIASMLSTLGCVTLPQDLLRRKFTGETISSFEEQIVAGHPAVAAELLRAIPRLDNVAEIVSHQNTPLREMPAATKPISLEIQILKTAIDFDLEEMRSPSSLHALNELKLKRGQYDAQVFEALADFIITERNFCVEKVLVQNLREGMVLASDIADQNGNLLMSKGQEITKSAARLLGNFTENNSLTEPILVVTTSQVEAV